MESIGKILCEQIAKPLHAEVQARLNEELPKYQLDCMKEIIVKHTAMEFATIMNKLDEVATLIDKILAQ